MSVDFIEMWHKRARPNPTDADFNVQLGCHIEEFLEMLETIELVPQQPRDWKDFESEFGDMYATLFYLSKQLKRGIMRAEITNRAEFLDAIADQVVTGVGAAHCAGMQATEAVRRVNESNWSKFDKDGQPIRDENGKIAKGPDYHAPDLEGLY